jgi:hypothetical protein
MDFNQSVAYLYSLGHEVLAAKFGLDGIRLLLERLGRPDRRFPSVIVAGTNGKGSVSAMLDSIARVAGLKSPDKCILAFPRSLDGLDRKSSEFCPDDRATLVSAGILNSRAGQEGTDCVASVARKRPDQNLATVLSAD